MSTAASDNVFKKSEHKRARSAVNARDLTLDDAPMGKEFGNPWGAPKDGKQWIDARGFPEIMKM